MPKFTDCHTSTDVSDIMEDIIDKFPRVFPGFDLNQIGIIHSNGKKSKKNPLKIRSVRYPYDVWMSKVYIIEVADETWSEMCDKKKHLSVFHTMCAMPEGAFDAQSDNYAKIRKPDYEMYAEEFAVTGGIPNWMDNDEARDPMEVNGSVVGGEEKDEKKGLKKATKRVPVTAESLVSSEEEEAEAEDGDKAVDNSDED